MATHGDSGAPGTSADSGEGSVYLVCDHCGYFYGDLRIKPDVNVDCPQCGSGAAWAFPTLEPASIKSAQIKHSNRARRPDASWGT